MRFSPFVSFYSLAWPLTCRRSLETFRIHKVVRNSKGCTCCLPGRSGALLALELHESRPAASPRTTSGLAGHKGVHKPMARKLPSLRILSSAAIAQSNFHLLPHAETSTNSTKRLQHTEATSHLHKSTSLAAPVWRVAVIGRANVGKSSLFNRFLMATSSSLLPIKRQQLAIVGPEPGTTRDRRETSCSLGSLNLMVADTAGVDLHCAWGDSSLLQQLEEQVAQTLKVSDVILFVVDAEEGVTPMDELFARRLRRLQEETKETKKEKEKGKEKKGEELNEGESSVHNERQEEQETDNSRSIPPSIILVLNKADTQNVSYCIAEAYELQLGHPMLVSTKTNQGLEELYHRVRAAVQTRQENFLDLLRPLEKQKETKKQETECSTSDLGRAAEGLLGAPGAPLQPAATEAWLEGLARRYGRGVRPTLGYMQSEVYGQLPWSLQKAPVLSTAEKAATKPKEEMRQKDKNAGQPAVEVELELNAAELSSDETEDENTKNGVFETEEETSECTNEEEKKPIRLTFIGRPNAGKSSLINSILKENRLAVSAMPGTTRDAICVQFTFKKQLMALTDTAGVTRGWKMRQDDLLHQASLQTMRNIRSADVCVLCLDATHIEETGHISSNDLSLANLATEKEGRCLVVSVTKWDLVLPNKQSGVRAMILERLQTGLGHLKWCPVVFTSATQAVNLETLLNKTKMVYRQWCSRVSTATLNAWLQEYTARWPPPWRLGSQCQVKYITQAQTQPPTFVAWSNVYAHFPLHYKRQLMNAIREEFDMKGIPLRLVLRTTAMPKPGAKLTKEEVLKWKRLGPHQHKAATKLARKYVVKK